MSLFSRWIDHIRENRDARAFTPSGVLRKAEANLERGVLTVDGFLGRDTRPLLRILREDSLAFADLGLDWDAVALRLEELLVLGSAGLGEPITIEDRYLVRVAETRGMLPCPWEDGLWRKRSAAIQRLDAGVPVGSEILLSDLSLHLLKEHRFLQGKGSPFRLEPSDLKTVLGEMPQEDDKAKRR
jgi:hypothetical protein